MSLFLGFFSEVAMGRRLGVLAGVFEGGSEKCCVLMWRFCGEFMVDCVVVVERRHQVLVEGKTCHEIEVYFRGCCGKAAKAIPFWERRTKGLKGPLFFAVIPGPFSL